MKHHNVVTKAAPHKVANDPTAGAPSTTGAGSEHGAAGHGKQHSAAGHGKQHGAAGHRKQYSAAGYGREERGNGTALRLASIPSRKTRPQVDDGAEPTVAGFDAAPTLAEPDAAQPERDLPELTERDAAQPKVGQPKLGESDAAQPGFSERTRTANRGTASKAAEQTASTDGNTGSRITGRTGAANRDTGGKAPGHTTAAATGSQPRIARESNRRASSPSSGKAARPSKGRGAPPNSPREDRAQEEIELTGGWRRTAVYAVRENPPYHSRAHQALGRSLPKDAQDPGEVALRIGVHCIEILKGHRPLAHIRSWVDPKVYAVIARRTSLALHLLGKAPKSQAPRARCLSLRWIQPRCVEAVVVVDDRRQHLLAMRLEFHRGKWRVCALEME